MTTQTTTRPIHRQHAPREQAAGSPADRQDARSNRYLTGLGALAVLCSACLAGSSGPADADHDGVPDAEDLCPNSSSDSEQVGDGCAADQVDEDGNPIVPPNHMTTFYIDGDTDTPIVLRTLPAHVTETQSGFEIEGTVLIDTPLGHVPMAQASLSLELRDGAIERVRGRAGLPFPKLGALASCEPKDLAMVEVGLDRGDQLTELGAPLADERRYLFFQMYAGIDIECGHVSITHPDNIAALAVFDPLDPMLYMEGNLFGLGGLGPIEDIGLGISAQGLMPFTPLQSLEELPGGDSYTELDGHFFAKGSATFQKVLSIDGELMIDLDPSDTGSSVFVDPAVGMAMAANGALGVGIDFLSFASFGFDLGEATMVAQASEDHSYALIAGQLAPDTTWLPVPILPEVATRVEGLISSRIEDSYLSVDTLWQLDLSDAAAELGITLNAMRSIEGHLAMSREVGIELRGRTATSFSPLIDLNQEIELVARYHSSDDWQAELRGEMSVGGIDLGADATMHLSPQGLFVEGRIDTGLSFIEVSGRVGPKGLALYGEAGVVIDLVAGKDVINTVIDGALCGYAVVKDGALCGYHSVTSAAICGTQTVTSAAICGTKTIESAAECGVKSVGCWLNPFNWGSCEVPKSCKVAKSCPVANTCEDLSAPKSCTDLGKPLSCEQHSVIPDYNYGQFEGSIVLALDHSGLSGQVSGDYCIDGTCASLVDGHLKLGSPLEACIDLSLGQFCAAF